VIGIRVGVTPHRSPEQLDDVTYYTEASAADGKNVSVCKLLAQALTGNSAQEAQGAIAIGKAVVQKPKAGDDVSKKEEIADDGHDLPKDD
jgi:hypothetical protein